MRLISSERFLWNVENYGKIGVFLGGYFFFFFFETFLFILDYILRPRSVLPPVPVEDLCSACIDIKVFYIQY